MKLKPTLTLITIFLLVLATWLAAGLGPWIVFRDGNVSAQFGDTFGAASSLFSAVALLFVIFTIFKQDKESASRDKQHKEMLQLQALSTLAQVQLTKWTEANSDARSGDNRQSIIRMFSQEAARKHHAELDNTTKKLKEILEETGIIFPTPPKGNSQQ